MFNWNYHYDVILKPYILFYLTALTMEKSSLKKKAKRMVYGALVFAWHKLTDTYWFLRFHRMIDYKQRQRSLSDSTVLVSSGAFTAEKLRKTQSYTAFPHIIKKSTCFGDEPSLNFYRTSCFRIMPHLSEGSFNNENLSKFIHRKRFRLQKKYSFQ